MYFEKWYSFCLGNVLLCITFYDVEADVEKIMYERDEKFRLLYQLTPTETDDTFIKV